MSTATLNPQRSGPRSYVDCPDCGPGQDASFNGRDWYCLNTAACRRRPLWTRPSIFTAQQRATETMHTIAKPRHIEVKGGQPNRKSECKPICTSGRVSCDCRCYGKCHGAGRCLGGH